MKLWFEREILPAFVDLVPPEIEQLGPSSATPDDPLATIGTANGAIASTFYYNPELLSKAPDLLVISRTGIGYDRVDVAAASAAGVAVCNTPEGPTISTAEFAITLMMTVAKSVKAIEKELHQELEHGTKRLFYPSYTGIELYGKRLGLVGIGRIGSHVARIAQSMGMEVSAYDPYLAPERAKEINVTLVGSLEALLNSADVVSLHLPLTLENQQFMNAERFAQMKSGAIFINTSRGGHVDEVALLDALESGHLFGAGLDVTDPEPPTFDNPLLQRDDVVISPHIASGTIAGKNRIYSTALEQALMVLRGEQPPHMVNAEIWPYVRERWEALQS